MYKSSSECSSFSSFLKKSLVSVTQKVNFTSATHLPRLISQVITSKQYLLARRRQPAKEFKCSCLHVCACLRVAGVEEVSAECNAAVRRVMTHCFARSHSPINRDGLKKATAGGALWWEAHLAAALPSHDVTAACMLHAPSYFSPGVEPVWRVCLMKLSVF